MWKHIHDIFVNEGATNVRWLWCPNEDDDPPSVPYESYYPGDEYVDYLCYDSYNWGTTQSYTTWKTPTETFGPTYNALTKVFNKPIIIGETGCAEQGGDKAVWIRDAFLTDIPQKFPRIIGVLVFSNNQDGSNWSVNTSEASLNVFKEVMKSPIWQYRLP
jgi:endoglucanase